MKLIISVILLWTIFSTAEGILCRVCTDRNDSTCANAVTTNCSDTEKCLSARVSYSNGQIRLYYSCGSDNLDCLPGNNRELNINLGDTYIFAEYRCCYTDNCNTDENFSNINVNQPFNNFTCTGCNSGTPNCSAEIQCRGLEKTCIRAFIETVDLTFLYTYQGCGSSNVCELTNVLCTLPFLEEHGKIIAPATCSPAIAPTTAAPTTTTTAAPTTEETTTTTPCPVTLLKHLDDCSALLRKLHQLSCKVKRKVINTHALSLIHLHQDLISYQMKLIEQQMMLTDQYDYNMPLTFQQNMVLSHQQLVLHQIYQHLQSQQFIPHLFNQQLLLNQLQQQLHLYQHGLMLHFNNDPLNNYYLHSLLPTDQESPDDYPPYQYP
ncbi:uncharacterized protein LOC114474812 [Gouania willdenowi]|uniref:uncharacterized protein LOC114474812 n=1 Tax=Gouania willdenowi TaxID=441366 RepID=UPI0010553B19|nr:uncharacterized protein LOC114474812 [Gouania willdenowi]